MPKRVPLATPGEVAEFLGKTEKTLAQWRWRGVGPRFIKLENGAVRYDWLDVDKYVQGQAVDPRGAA